MNKKVVRHIVKALAWVIGIIAVVWMILWIYVGLNEKAIIGKISTKIKNKTRGEVSIGGLSVSFFRTFPILSLQLSNVMVRDSLYPIHKKDFFNAGDVYLKLSIPGLLTGKSPLGQVMISNGNINILTNADSSTNEYILRSDKKPDENDKSSMPDILLRNVQITYINPLRNKFHHAVVNSMKCSFSGDSRMRIGINTDMTIKSLAFNTEKGPYLKDKRLRGNFVLIFDKDQRNLVLNNIRLDIENHPFIFNGVFHMEKSSPDFQLSIKTNNIDFALASSILTDTIQQKLKGYSMSKPIDLQADLSGKTLYKFIPLVNITMKTRDNELTSSKGVFSNCTFDALLSNEVVAGKPRNDENSLVQFSAFSGTWEKIPIVAKLIKITNFKSPFLECDLKSDIDLSRLNELAGSSTLDFVKGSATISVLFKGPVTSSDSMAAHVDGVAIVRDASIKYLPRNFLLKDCSGSVRFKNTSLFVDKFTATMGQTILNMNGSAENFLSLVNSSPEKLVLHWKISSNRLHLDDFKSFLSKAQSGGKQAEKAKFRSASSQVDKMFMDGEVYINLKTPVMEYKHFTATDVRADVILKKAEMALENVSFNHAKGTMNINGTMTDGKSSNPVFLHTTMSNMDIPVLFTSFDNFGQDAITHSNLKGRLSADIIFNTAITNTAELVNEGSHGTIDFLLEDGELNNFEPIQKVSEKVFKKQDFTAIKFADIKNKLEVNGTSFIVNPMEIRSTAITMFVQGVYDVKKGTDMSIRLPLRNLTKRQANTDLSDEGKSKAGIAVRLRAKSGEDGKLKLSWDPFGKSVKNKEEADSTVSKATIADSTGLKN